MGAEKKMSAYDVINAFFDEGSFVERDAYLKSASGEAEAITGFGSVNGMPVYAFVQNSDVCSGAMSKAQALKITKLYSLALKTGAPVVGFYQSAGGRIEQKYELLAAYGDILAASAKLSGVVPRLSVVLGDCVGASAVIAACADFLIMSKSAQLCSAVSGDDGSADANVKNGVAQFIAEDTGKAVEKAKELLGYLPSNNLESAPAYEPIPPYDAPDRTPKYIADSDSLICVGGGRGDDVCTAFGRVNGDPVGFVVTNGGSVSADGADKLKRHIRFCDAFSIPVITLVDAESFDSLSDAAALASAYADATTAKISVVTGTAVGSAYIALAGTGSGADIVYALPDSVVSPVTPKAAAYILDPSIADLPYSDQAAAIDRFIKENLTAEIAAADGYIDDIAEKEELRAKISSALDMLSSKRVSALPKKHTTI